VILTLPDKGYLVPTKGEERGANAGTKNNWFKIGGGSSGYEIYLLLLLDNRNT